MHEGREDPGASSGLGGVVTEITLFIKPDGILSKRITLGEDGQPRPDGSACRMTRGTARRHRMNGGRPAATLAATINELSGNAALSLGRLVGQIEVDCHVVTEKQRKQRASADGTNDGTPVIARTREHFGWSDGPGWALVDFDGKGMPEGVRQRLAALGGQEGALRSLIPGFDDGARVSRRSTSSGLYHAESGTRFSGSEGRHDYLLLADQRDASRFLETLHRRAWLAGLGWIVVGTAGQLLERSVIDCSVGSPERLVFEGAPLIVPPLAQDESQRLAVPSPATAPLDSRTVVPDLAPEELAEYRRRVEAAKAVLRSEAKQARQAWLAREGARLGPDGGRLLKAALERHILSGGIVLHFDDEEIGAVTIDTVMAKPGRYDGETLADPLDGLDYGAGKAKLFFNEDGSIVVHSFAHGGRTFRLLHSATSARAALEQAGADAAVVFTKVLLAAEITPSEEDLLVGLVAELTGRGKRPLKAELKHAKAEAAREQASKYEETAARGDRRVVKRAPFPDGERLPVIAGVEVELLKDLQPSVFQNARGEVVRVVWRHSALLHLLTSETAAGGVHADLFAPAPASPLIVPHTIETIRAEVERRIRYLQEPRESGPPRAVTLPDPFLRAFLAPRPDSRLPLLTAISDVPVVTPAGKLIVGGGYHAPSGIYFTCTEAEARAVVPDDVSDEAVKAAYCFLAEELFADVAWQDGQTGLAALVAFLLTGIVQPILPEKPLFCIGAPQRGSGKTTLVNMITRVLLRRAAAAAAWSPNEEERRKAFFAAAREGHAILLVDNIPRGTTIRDATLERFATSAEISDRVLGESRTEAVRSPVIALTGNALRMGGDGGSRTLTIELTAERPDPENRAFRHPDIFDWINRHRAKILRAALTILLGNPTLQNRSATIETRFKAWFVLVGSAVEHAAKQAGKLVRMVELIGQTEADDETTGALAEMLELLRQLYPKGEFTIEELASKLSEASNGPADNAAALLLEMLNGLRRQPLRMITGRTVGATLQNHVKGVPIDDGDGGIWVISPKKRSNNKERVVWRIERPGAPVSGRL